MTLREITIRALFWSFFERIGQNGIQFVIAIILARLLAPAEFGLISMLTIFMAVAQSFIDSGFGSALIQKQDASHIDECSIFYFNILVGIIMAGLLCFVAPWIAVFYNAPILVPLTRALSLNLVINAFGLIQTSLLTKQIDFKAQLKVSLLATFFSGVIGITMAYKGFGVWSLVTQSLSQNFIRSCILWILMSWRPSLTFSIVSLRTMFSFGSKLLFSGLIDTIYRNIYSIIIGKFFSAADVGFYTRAASFQQISVMNITASLERVAYPVFSSIQDDRLRLKAGVRKSIMMMAMLNFPMMIGLAIVAKPLVLLLLTEKWLPCVPYLQLLCAVGLLYPLHSINLSVLNAQGRSDIFFGLEILKKILAAIVIFITFRWGISAMIIGQIITSFACYYLNSYYTGKLISYSFLEQVRDIIPTLSLSCLMGGIIFCLQYIPILNHLGLLILQIIVGIVVYIALCIITKSQSFFEIVRIARPIF